MNFPTGKRLQPFLPDLVDRLEYFGELTLDVTIRTQLLAMSAASIDRFLAAERRQAFWRQDPWAQLVPQSRRIAA